MGLKYDPNEDLESWMIRVQSYELDLAKKQLAKGVPVDKVLERMSKNISNKMLHPVIVNLTDVKPNLEEDTKEKILITPRLDNVETESFILLPNIEKDEKIKRDLQSILEFLTKEFHL